MVLSFLLSDVTFSAVVVVEFLHSYGGRFATASYSPSVLLDRRTSIPRWEQPPTDQHVVLQQLIL